MFEPIKEFEAKRKTCPLLPTRLVVRPDMLTGERIRHAETSHCAGQRCLWWCGEDEGYCVVKVLEPLAEALLKLTTPVIMVEPGKPLRPGDV